MSRVESSRSRLHRKVVEKGHMMGPLMAQSLVGFAYHYGEGVPVDNAESVAWYRKAAVQGHADSQYELGRAYCIGEGVPVDKAAGVDWYHKAAARPR
jgi:TPR repeat protein